MKIFKNGKNWIIEEYLDKKIIEKINDFIDKNLDNFVNLKEGYSTKGKNSEQYWIIKNGEFYFKDKKFEDIKNLYRSEILNILKKSNILDERAKNIIDIKDASCWTVIGGKDSYHAPHNHCGYNSGISTVLYLRVPETNVEDEPENSLYLIMNSEPNNRYYRSKPPYITINPMVGKILIFPDWIIHGTMPQSDGIRQTFNMDYNFICKKENNINLSYN